MFEFPHCKRLTRGGGGGGGGGGITWSKRETEGESIVSNKV